MGRLKVSFAPEVSETRGTKLGHCCFLLVLPVLSFKIITQFFI